eukprot:GHVU01152754.1.p1 GENE.GHVU01152754.1~~GHVU01152754.1.p1  ORF type:complete len:210 (-),score=15.55 GHVU01152754.1:20-649(-)
MAGYYSPRAVMSRWVWGSPTPTEERFETNYREVPDHPPMPAGSVGGAVDMTIEAPGVVPRPETSPNGPPEDAAALWTPHDVVTSTPVAPETAVAAPAVVLEMLTPVVGPAGASSRTLGPAMRPAESPDSLFGDDDGEVGLHRPGERKRVYGDADMERLIPSRARRSKVGGGVKIRNSQGDKETCAQGFEGIRGRGCRSPSPGGSPEKSL